MSTMTAFPLHFLPNFTEEAKGDALFHYTTAAGLIGIFEDQAIRGTAYYCANDEQELVAGKGVLTVLFREELFRLKQDNDPRIRTFDARGVDPFEYADDFEGLITSLTLSWLCAYITCFCKAAGPEDFTHGLLSQWRGYGLDGGYALQFSRARLQAAIDAQRQATSAPYELKDVHYGTQNNLRAAVLSHRAAFLTAFGNDLDELAQPLDSRRRRTNPVPGLLPGPLESLLDYLVHTKNTHFAEERECRLSLIQPTAPSPPARPVRYFNRGGLPVPYITTPRPGFDVLGCVDWILIGPGPRMDARLKSVSHLIRQSGKEIRVRPSHIPYTRL